MRKKRITLAICVLALLMVVSVGFAAWVINVNNSVDSDEGNFVVENVSNGYVIKSVTLGTQKSIKFGKPKEMPNPDYSFKWLECPETVDNLEVEVTIKFDKFDNDANIDNAKGLKLTMSYYSGETTKTLPADVVAAPTFAYKIGSNSRQELTGDTIDADIVKSVVNSASKTMTVYVTFAWGTAFNGNNPYIYYNTTYNTSELVTATVMQGAYTNLKAVYDMNAWNFKLNVADATN